MWLAKMRRPSPRLCYLQMTCHIIRTIGPETFLRSSLRDVCLPCSPSAAAYCATQHPDFSRLAARISVSNLHKNTTKSFSKAIELFHSYIHPKTGRHMGDVAYESVRTDLYMYGPKLMR